MFVNEANKINFDTYRELTSRANQIFIDFNPNNLFWFHTEIATRNDCDFIKLTFLDNECLGKEEKGEILRYKELGYQADNTGNFAVNEKGELVVINQYWANMWRVYGLGEVGQVEGRIYNWKPYSLADYLKINKTTYYGVDWGKVDPFAVTELKYHDGDLYVRQKNYASENEIERNMQPELLKSIRGGESINSTGQRHDGLVSYVFNQIGIPKNSNVICDNNRPNKILSLRNAGWEYTVAVGGKVDLVNRISTLSGLNIYYTDDSKNIESEQMNYCYDKDRNGVLLESPIDQNNHSIDSIAYGVQWMFKQGIIKNI